MTLSDELERIEIDAWRDYCAAAPPSFAQAVAQFDPDYFLRPKPGEKWFGSAKGDRRAHV